MVARSVKNYLKTELRQLMTLVRVPAHGPYVLHVVGFLNEIFVSDRFKFWTKKVKVLIKNKFVVGLEESEMATSSDLSTKVNLNILLEKFQGKKKS